MIKIKHLKIDIVLRSDYKNNQEDMIMHVTFVEFTDEEYELIKIYCTLHGSSLSDALKKALLEKIEDEFDLAEYKAAKKRYDENPISYSLDEIRNELNLQCINGKLDSLL